MNVQGESAKHVRWDVCQGQGCDIAHLCRGVQRKKTMHGNLGNINVQSISKTNREVLEDLS